MGEKGLFTMWNQKGIRFETDVSRMNCSHLTVFLYICLQIFEVIYNKYEFLNYNKHRTTSDSVSSK
jgi:hypothetical protein